MVAIKTFPFPSHGYTACIWYNNTLFVTAGHIEICNTVDVDNCAIVDHDRICGYNLITHIWSCYTQNIK